MGTQATPSEPGRQRGQGPAAARNVPCPRPRSQGSGFPVPRQPERSRHRHSAPCRAGGKERGHRQVVCRGWGRWQQGEASLGTETRTPKAHWKWGGGMHLKASSGDAFPAAGCGSLSRSRGCALAVGIAGMRRMPGTSSTAELLSAHSCCQQSKCSAPLHPPPSIFPWTLTGHPFTLSPIGRWIPTGDHTTLPCHPVPQGSAHPSLVRSHHH